MRDAEALARQAAALQKWNTACTGPYTVMFAIVELDESLYQRLSSHHQTVLMSFFQRVAVTIPKVPGVMDGTAAGDLSELASGSSFESGGRS